MVPVNDATNNTKPRLVAVVVLYGTAAEASATLRSLHAAMDASPETAGELEVVVWDNTPGVRERPAGFAGTYWHTPSNPGLAAAYNRALDHARERGAQWVITLDQDTHITTDYLQEMLHVTRHTSAAAVLPRLVWRGRMLSPFRPRTQGPALPLEESLTGDTSEYLQAFNSGAALSVAFLSRAGGFDLGFPLDYLDHATFARVHREGGSIHVLRAHLEHELSSQTPGRLTSAAMQRERSVLASERRFVRAYGTPDEQRMYPVRILRRAASVLVHRRDPALALLIVRTLLGANR